jgi:hypothetical protein
VSATRKPESANELRQADFSVAHPVAHESGNQAESGIPEPTVIDPDVAAVNAAWPTLPAVICTGIVAMVKSAGV